MSNCNPPIPMGDSKCSSPQSICIEKPKLNCEEICKRTDENKCKLTPSNILRTSDSTRRQQNSSNPSTLRCCKNIRGPPSQSPCGYFYVSSIFNMCRFKNTFRTTCLRTGCTNYMAINPKLRGLGKKISSHTLHGVESVNDLRAWSVCKDDQRKYFLEHMYPVGPSDYESDYGDEPGGPRFDRLRDRAVEKDPRTGRDIPADASASSTLSTIRGAGGGNEVVAGVAQGRGIRKGRRSDDDDDVGAEDISNDEAANASGTGPFGSEGDNAEAGANARSTGSSSTAIRKDEKKSNSSQTPPLALANLVDALDEEEKKRLFEELARAEGIGSGKSSDEKDEEIGKLLNRIKELENACTDYKIKSGGGEGAGGSGGSCIIETSLDFDDKMKPVNAETRMNYVVTPGSTSAKSCQNVDPKILEEIKEILSRLGCDSNALLSLNEEQCMWVHKALTSMVQENSPPPVEPSAIAEDKCYTYEMETTVDFHVGQNGDLSVLGAEGKILPSESIAKVSPGAKPLENRSRSGSGSGSGNGRMNLVDRSVGGDSPVMEPDLNSSNVPWDQLQRTQEGRLHESDARVEVEVLKTQLDMVQQALEFEKEKNFCMDQTSTASELNQLLTQERARVQELRSVLDQQNMEVACLTERLQELELTVIGKGDLAASAPPNYQIPVDLQVAYAQMSYPHDVSPFHNQTYVVKHNPAIVEPVGPPSVMQRKETTHGRDASQKWYELYLRAKSYRKALAWQKKYLAVVVQGYKDLLGISGAAFEHPDLLQKQVPITPSSVGLCDKKKGKTRFRIVGKVVLASIRMKYMVNRWSAKVSPRVAGEAQKRVAHVGSSRFASASSSSSESDGWDGNQSRVRDKPRTVTFSALSPPTKDSGKGSRSAPSRSTNLSGLPKTGSRLGISTPDADYPAAIDLSKHKLAVTGVRSANKNTVQSEYVQPQPPRLSQYFERFQSLEKEIGSTISRLPATGTSRVELLQKGAVQK